MNPYTQHTEQHPPAAPAPTPKRRRRWIAPALTGAAAFFAGSIVGATGASTDTADAPEPEVITETETVVETVTEYIVPDSCLMAIDEAREGFTIAAEVMAVISPAVEAAFYRDVYGMESATADLEALNVDMSRLDFVNQAAACEEAAR